MFGRLFLADAKILVRNKQSLFWALAFPVMFATIFGLFDFENLPDAKVAVYAEDPRGAAPVLAGLKNVTAVRICGEEDADGEIVGCGPFDPKRATEARARAALKSGDVGYVLIIPRTGTVTLAVNEQEADTNRIFVPVFERVIDQVNINLAGVERRYVLQQEQVSGKSPKYYDFIMPGLVGMAVMTYGIIGLASTIAQYRGQRILRRILATPLKPRTFLAAIVAAHLVLALIQSAIVLAVGVFVFGGSVRGNLLYIVPFVLVANLTFLNIGFMVASRVDTTEAASGLGNAVSMPMMFFSGVFFPTSTLPWIMPALTALLPLRPLVDALRSITLDAASITDLGSEMLQLVGWAVVTFLIASRMFRFDRA